MCNRPQQQWDIVQGEPLLADGDATGGVQLRSRAVGYVQLRSRAEPGRCLSSSGVAVAPHLDPWCAANNNMWRVSTDVIQTWTRTMIELESMAHQGTLSAPGAWSFPDCLEVGHPPGCCRTRRGRR